jgi:nicotinamide mononucleotide transporter
MNFNSLLLQLPEITAVVFAILYLALAIKQNILCWTAWILSSCLYTYVMYSADLYMEALLQIFYVVMGIYGWHQWLNRNSSKQELSVSTWQPAKHASAVTLIFVLAYVSGLLLEKYTAAALPFLDAFTTWGAIVTTYMVANKVLENWIYWFVIDSISIYLFISRGLYFTAFLFIIYLFMIVVGYRTWQQSQVSIND